MALSDILDMLPSIPDLLTPLHLLSYSTLFGAQLYQTFIMTNIAFQELPRPVFLKFQQRAFPTYFRGQSLMIVLTAATFPLGPAALFHKKLDWVPFAIAGMTAALNFFVYGPRTLAAMLARYGQGSEAAPKENGKVTPEMKALSRTFSRNHAMSIHFNLITIGGMVLYGLRLASGLKLNAE